MADDRAHRASSQNQSDALGWILLLAVVVLLFPFWRALMVAVVTASIAHPIGAMVAAVIYGGPVLGGFLIVRELRSHWRRCHDARCDLEERD